MDDDGGLRGHVVCGHMFGLTHWGLHGGDACRGIWVRGMIQHGLHGHNDAMEVRLGDAAGGYCMPAATCAAGGIHGGPFSWFARGLCQPEKQTQRRKRGEDILGCPTYIRVAADVTFINMDLPSCSSPLC